jgi:uracil-DNA glycosylase
MQEQIETSWQKILVEEFKQAYFLKLSKTIDIAYLKPNIFPARDNIFTAFKICLFSDVKVVILGQDPYHATGQAHGLAFSVQSGVKLPPSLKNIYLELAADIAKTVNNQPGNLEAWAKQGVLLLNTVLTVESGKPGSHQGIGWEIFTDAVIKKISAKETPVVFILWGKPAASKIKLIDTSKHLVLTAPHPSPLSAYRGFFGCKHFSLTNQFLIKHNLTPINW